jgi:two-component system OmpR family sensor kinase
VVMLVFSAAMAYPAARNLASPLEKLVATVKQFGAGDLSSRSQMRRHDEIGELAKSFDEMASRLETVLLSEKEIMANVSHELRTPVARIRVLLALATEDVDCDRSHYVSEIAADLRELETIIDDVLTAARLDLSQRRASAVGPVLRKQLIDPKNMVEQLAERFRDRTQGRAVQIRAAETTPMLYADPTLLRRAIDNLLDNANKYSEQETPITIQVSPKNAETVEIVVEDEGIGIEADEQERIFSPFFRSEKSRVRKRGGVGLGLTIVKRIVEAHEGSVSLESHHGKGARFALQLPLATKS